MPRDVDDPVDQLLYCRPRPVRLPLAAGPNVSDRPYATRLLDLTATFLALFLFSDLTTSVRLGKSLVRFTALLFDMLPGARPCGNEHFGCTHSSTFFSTSLAQLPLRNPSSSVFRHLYSTLPVRRPPLRSSTRHHHSSLRPRLSARPLELNPLSAPVSHRVTSHFFPLNALVTRCSLSLPLTSSSVA